MTGAAHTSNTSNMRKRPLAVCLASASATAPGSGKSYTVKPNGLDSRESALLSTISVVFNPLKPKVKKCQQRAEGKPLKSIGSIFIRTQAHLKPIAAQSVPIGASLHHQSLYIVLHQRLHLRRVQICPYGRWVGTLLGRSQFEYLRQRRRNPRLNRTAIDRWR